VKGYESGIDYKKIASTMPYMYTDEPERIKFVSAVGIIDQVIDWFGQDIKIESTDNEKEVIVTLQASPSAMEHWAMQYLNAVEILSPAFLRDRIRDNLKKASEKYGRK
jgi:predicted DNA-binding transcriptional regulator YafY